MECKPVNGASPLLNHITKLEELSRSLGYNFKQPSLLLQAVCHASYTNELGQPEISDNERLEFLGDAVLDLAVSDILMVRFEDATEGDLSKFRSLLVDETGLSQVARLLRLGDFILLGRGEAQGDGRTKPSILANTMEAIMGAVYLDAGFDTAKTLIQGLFGPLIDQVQDRQRIHDYKSLLQEYTQRVFRILPHYRLVEESGPPHEKVFKVALWLEEEQLSEGVGKSKKEAEQMAAREAFDCLAKD